MRPRHLEMEGFLAYRHRTVVDFEDADLFVLSGPTGAGKSSVIDAMVFALYGTIPRLDDRRVVEPVVSVRSDRARVAFTFTVEGETYQVARLVERRGSGATTTEARLQRGEEVIASGASEVSEAAADLLGLGFDHFTKAVVLPQGAFARFLLDQPRERQALLRALLDLGVFGQVMQLSNARATAAKARVEMLQERLDKLDVPGETQVAEARHRLACLEEAMRELETRLETLASARQRLADRRQRADGLQERLRLLGSVVVPDTLAGWEEEREAVRLDLKRAEEGLAERSTVLAGVTAALEAHPSRDLLERWKEARARLAVLERERARLDLDDLARAAEAAARARDEEREGLERLHRDHAAHRLRRGLAVGEPCPVCLAPVVEVPAAGPLQEVDELTAHLTDLEREADLARDRLKEAEGEARQLEARIVEMADVLTGVPDVDAIEAELATVVALEERRRQAEQARDEAGAEVERLRSSVHELEQRSGLLRHALVEARDLVAAEEPPRPDDDVVDSWRRFVEWREGRIAEHDEELERLTAELEDLSRRVSDGEEGLGSWLAGLGVDLATSAETDLALAVEKARAEVAGLEKTAAEASALGDEIEEEKARRVVAAELAKHLRADNFESWVMEEALDVLVEGANRLLDDLSGGAYSLVVRDRHFQVVDHLNAGAVRTTKGLSGGETFLVSLALALSMAEQLADLTGTTSRLESVFLDEGFGSLDQESLDVVAAVLDELVGRGRVVGLVTHVRDLADRMPVRFEVSKGVESATVRRVEA